MAAFQPHHAHVVHMGDDGSDGASLAIERFRLPCRIRQILDQIMVDAIVDVESVERLRQAIRVAKGFNGVCLVFSGTSSFCFSEATWQGL